MTNDQCSILILFIGLCMFVGLSIYEGHRAATLQVELERVQSILNNEWDIKEKIWMHEHAYFNGVKVPDAR